MTQRSSNDPKWERAGQSRILRKNGVPVATVKPSIFGFYFYAETEARRVNTALDGQYYPKVSQACSAASEWFSSHKEANTRKEA